MCTFYCAKNKYGSYECMMCVKLWKSKKSTISRTFLQQKRYSKGFGASEIKFWNFLYLITSVKKIYFTNVISYEGTTFFIEDKKSTAWDFKSWFMNDKQQKKTHAPMRQVFTCIAMAKFARLCGFTKQLAHRLLLASTVIRKGCHWLKKLCKFGLRASKPTEKTIYSIQKIKYLGRAKSTVFRTVKSSIAQ